MKKIFLLFGILFIQPFFSQKTQKENDSLREAIAFISQYYKSFTTEYDYNGNYKMLSNRYQPQFSGSKFTLTHETYDEVNNATVHSISIDFRNVINMKPEGGELVTIYSTETEQIPVALQIGFETKKKIEKVRIYVEDGNDITETPIYKAFETVWKYYKK